MKEGSAFLLFKPKEGVKIKCGSNSIQTQKIWLRHCRNPLTRTVKGNDEHFKKNLCKCQWERKANVRVMHENRLLFNNYLSKWKWIVVNIYRTAMRRGKYPPLATDIEGIVVFNIY